MSRENLETALRELQKLDELTSLGDEREHLLLAEDALGEALGLECSSDDPRCHNGGTCPIHEWFEPEDYYEVRPEERDAVES
jgi:hypothetical protein